MREGSHEQNLTSEDKQKKWQDYLTYPQHLTPKSVELLDQITSLIPLPEHSDRYVIISELIENALNKGLITRQERLTLREDIAQNL